MGSTAEHTALVNNILVALSQRRQMGFFWKNPTGAIQAEDERYQRYGLPGSPDIVGMSSRGQWVGIECKTGEARLSKLQINFKNRVETNKGTVLEGRSVEQVLKDLERLNAIPS